MPNTPQTSAVNAALELTAILGRARQLYQDAKALASRETNESYTGVWANLPTATQNADGSLGATDGSPNIAHPISGFGIFRSKTALTNGLALLQQFIVWMENGVPIQSNWLDSLDAVVG